MSTWHDPRGTRGRRKSEGLAVTGMSSMSSPFSTSLTKPGVSSALLWLLGAKSPPGGAGWCPGLQSGRCKDRSADTGAQGWKDGCGTRQEALELTSRSSQCRGGAADWARSTGSEVIWGGLWKDAVSKWALQKGATSTGRRVRERASPLPLGAGLADTAVPHPSPEAPALHHPPREHLDGLSLSTTNQAGSSRGPICRQATCVSCCCCALVVTGHLHVSLAVVQFGGSIAVFLHGPRGSAGGQGTEFTVSQSQ